MVSHLNYNTALPSNPTHTEQPLPRSPSLPQLTQQIAPITTNTRQHEQPLASFDDMALPMNKPFGWSVDNWLANTTDEATFSQQMQSLYERLLDMTPSQANDLLGQLQHKQEIMGEEAFFKTHHFKLSNGNELIFQSVFEPEAWSAVLREGIQTAGDMKRDVVVEVGCGNGHACRQMVGQNGNVIGVDLNPDAVLNAKLNMLLSDQRHLAFTSDLLATIMAHNVSPKVVLACIPQIKENDAPADTESDSNSGTNIEANTDATANDTKQPASNNTIEAREKLSHQYSGVDDKYAFYDQFGLGLNAKFLDQLHTVLPKNENTNEFGKAYLNIAGRLGPEIITQMFDEFGFAAKPAATRIFPQQTTALETIDISFFVELEQAGLAHCEFFSDASGTPEKRISAHAAQQILDAGGIIYHGVTCYELNFKEALDTAQANAQALQKSLSSEAWHDYPDITGGSALQEAIQHRFANAGVSVDANNIMLYPSKQEAERALACLYDPETSLLDLSSLSNKSGLTFTSQQLLGEQLTAGSSSAYAVVARDSAMIDAMGKYGEISYGRPLSTVNIAALTQQLTAEYQNTRTSPSSVSEQPPLTLPSHYGALGPLNPVLATIFDDPALEANMPEISAQDIVANYGVNLLKPDPRWLSQCTTHRADPFLRAPEPAQLQAAIANGLNSHITGLNDPQWQTFDSIGSQACFDGLMQSLAQHHDNPTLIVPPGVYSEFKLTGKLNGVTVKTADTQPEALYKYTPDDIRAQLAADPNAVIYIAPLSATTSQRYSAEELSAIGDVIRQHNAQSPDHQSHLIVDVIFSMLEKDAFTADYDAYNALALPSEATTILWSPSKMGPGGLRYGAVLTNDPLFDFNTNEITMPKVDSATQHTVKDYMQTIADTDRSEPNDFLQQRVTELNQLREATETALRNNGWAPLESDGGLCVAAKPTDQLLGKTVMVNGEPQRITAENLSELLHLASGILANGPDWTGMAEHRFIVSSEQAQSLPQRLQHFYEQIQG